MAIPDEDVAAVRAATDVVALIGEHTALRRVGRRWVGLCPFHGEKTPSFSVNGEEGLYYCFGCQASGDAISFVRAVEGCDFVEAIERLAARAGVTVRNDDDGRRGAERGRRQQLYEALAAAADYYHERLLSGEDAAPARRYLRGRGYDGEVVRRFRLGFAPATGDELVRALRLPSRVLAEAGLAWEGRGRPQDAFRDRVIFPISDAGGRVVALGGRVLPEDLRRSRAEPGPKYRNSSESPVYSKRRTLYGLNWAKAEISRSGEAVVCEGYTDVIGFFEAGVPRAVATCGTSLTEDHIRLLANFAKRIVLAFDADSAGQSAAARLYDWERRHEIELAVADLPAGSDPAELAAAQPAVLAEAVASARPFLRFRVEQELGRADRSSPEGRSRAAQAALAMVAEHPDELVRDQYLVEVADVTRNDPDRLREILERQRAAILAGDRPPGAPTRDLPPGKARSSPDRTAVAPPAGGDAPEPPRSNGRGRPPGSPAGREALALLVHRREEMLPLLDGALFDDPLQQSAFQALLETPDLHQAIEQAPLEVADLLRQLAVSELPADADPGGTLLALARTGAGKALAELAAEARVAARSEDGQQMVFVAESTRYVQQELELMRDAVLVPSGGSPALEAASRLVAWLSARKLGG